MDGKVDECGGDCAVARTTGARYTDQHHFMVGLGKETFHQEQPDLLRDFNFPAPPK
jgi:hypothetical protein